MAEVLSIIILLLSLLQVVISGVNNIPHPRNLEKVRDCSKDEVCIVDLIVEPLMSMTYYNISDNFRDLRGYRAYYHDSGLDFHNQTFNNRIDRTMLREPITVDGEFRSIITINYQMPGPTIIVNKNQRLLITVYNEMTNGEGISIHWHGIHQMKTFGMDGVAHLTQEPIPTYQSFIYNFTASPSGTHWYHAHSSTHRTEGLYGALIVMDPNAHPEHPNIVDQPEQHTLLLMDWQKEASIDLFHQIRSSLPFTKPTSTLIRYSPPDSIDGTEIGPIPFWSGIINDKGRHYYEDGNHNGADLSVFNVTFGNQYRFRLIGSQALYAYKFSIQNHTMTVIATDGNHIKSINNVHYVIVNTGERYDVVVNANQTDGNYWILAETLEDPRDNHSKEEGRLKAFHNPIHLHRAEAILHYANASDAKDFYRWNFLDTTWDDTSKRNYVNCPFLTKEQSFPFDLPASPTANCINVDQFVNLENDIPLEIYRPVEPSLFYNFGFDGEQTTRGSSADGINFRFPSYLPNSKEFYSSGQMCPNRGCDHDFQNIKHCACTQVININHVEEGQCVELVITNHQGVGNDNIESSHPVHLHGHYFHVVKVGYPSYKIPDTTNSIGSSLGRTYNLQNEDVTCKRTIPNNRDGSLTCERFITVERGGDYIQEVMWADNIQNTSESMQNMNESMRNMNESMRNMNESMQNTSESSTYVRKDTVIVPFGGYVVIRFIVNNPGWWFLHCHIEIHQLEGMAAVIQELMDPPQNVLPSTENTQPSLQPSPQPSPDSQHFRSSNGYYITTIIVTVLVSVFLLL